MNGPRLKTLHVFRNLSSFHWMTQLMQLFVHWILLYFTFIWSLLCFLNMFHEFSRMIPNFSFKQGHINLSLTTKSVDVFKIRTPPQLKNLTGSNFVTVIFFWHRPYDQYWDIHMSLLILVSKKRMIVFTRIDSANFENILNRFRPFINDVKAISFKNNVAIP